MVGMSKPKNLHISGILTATILLIFNTGNAQVPTNQQVLADLIVQPVLAALDSQAHRQDGIQIVLKDKNEVGRWAVADLREALLKRNYILYDSLTSPSREVGKIVFEKINNSIRYRAVDRNLLFRATKYAREIEATVSFFIENGQNSILHSRTKTHQYDDVIERSTVKLVENVDYPFTIGTKSESKFLKWLVEPALVTVTTAGVVYLFYTLRSSS